MANPYKVTNFRRSTALEVAVGLTAGGAAGSGQVVVTDGTTEVDAIQVTFDGATVTDRGGGIAEVGFSANVDSYTNNSGVDLAAGDVVVLDSAGNVSTTTTAQDTRVVGIVQAPITNGSVGPVAVSGPVDLVNVVASVTQGQYGETSTTAKKAQAHTGRETGSFCIFTSNGTTPSAVLWNPPDTTVTSSSGTFVEAYNGGNEGVKAHGTTGSTETINLADGNIHTATLDASCTFTFSGATNGKGDSFTLILSENGTGGYSPTWPGSVTWIGGVTPTHDTTASSTTTYIFWTVDGGSNWTGAQVGGGGTESATATHLWRPVLASDGTIVTAGSGGEAVMAYGPA